MSTLDAAKKYIARGWAPIPIPHKSKNPGRTGWQKTRITTETVREHFNCQPQNIGILLGEPSGWLIDVDLDHPAALQLANTYLPPTPAMFGRASNPLSHRLYRVTSPVKTKKYEIPRTDTMVVELRSTGMQTVFPPSKWSDKDRIKPDEQVEWHDADAEPMLIDPTLLRTAVQRLYDAVLADLGVMPSEASAHRNDDPGMAREAMQALSNNRAANRKDWIDVGMAAHSVSDSLLADWIGFSRCCPDKFVDGECEKIWQGFKPDGGVGIGTLIHMAIADGWTPPWKRRKPKQKQSPRDVPPGTDPLSIIVEQSLTDVGNARRFIRMHGNEVRYCYPWSKWLAWDGTRWKMDDTGDIERRAKMISDGLWKEAQQLGDRDGRRFATATASNSKISAMLSQAQSEVPILPADLDSDPWLLNCANGTLDLQTGELRPHSQADFITKLVPTSYDPDAEAYAWDRFLEGVFDGDDSLVRFVQRVLGYCLTGQTSEHILSIFWGGGSNGKTTLLEAFMHALGPDYSMSASSDLLLAKKGERHPTEIADLHGKRFVLCAESDEGRRLNEGLVKQLTGGDTLRARRMREDFWQFSPTHKVVLCTNHKPEVKGTDHAMWRRLRLVPFTVRYWDPSKGESGPAELRQDKSLPTKLKEIAPGILAWAVQGCLEWQRQGLGEPEAVRAATTEYREDEDVIRRFLDERCVIGVQCNARSSELYAKYREWCDAMAEYYCSQRRFGEAMTERGFERYTNNGTFYKGIGLLSDHHGTNGT